VLGLAEGGLFSEKVLYIYRKQLEEADLIVINKRELLTANQLAALRQALASAFPHAEILEISARRGEGLEPWFGRLLSAASPGRAAISVDYSVYGEGEALLGWLNATVKLSAPVPFDGNALLRQLADAIRRRLAQHGGQIAHLKMTLDPDDSVGDLGVVNVVRNDLVAESSQELHDTLESGCVIINVRAEASPDLLRTAVSEAVAGCGRDQPGLQAKLEHLEVFRPGQPRPTHRIETP
jgi:hypothetical protein